MRQVPRPSTFVPPGLVVDRIDQVGEAMVVIVRSSAAASPCPGCRASSKRIHSRYRRCLSDLPWAGRSVQLVLLARRLYCDAVLCGRRIFTERFAPEVLAPWGAERPVWMISCTTSVWRWAVDPPRASPADSWSRPATTSYCAWCVGAAARTIARLMTLSRDHLCRSETVTVAAIEGGVSSLVEARELVAAFQAMIRKKALADLQPWIERARGSLIASFVNGVVKDQAAVSRNHIALVRWAG